MKKSMLIMCLFSLGVYANPKDGSYNSKNKGAQSNVNSSTGHQNVQYCNMPKEIKVINECKPVVTQKIVYRDRPCKKKCYKTQKPKVVYKTRVKTRTKVVEKIVVRERPILKNSIRLLGGYGPTGVSAEKVGNRAVAFEEDGAVFGLGYTRRLNRRWSVEGNILTNETYLLGVGLSF